MDENHLRIFQMEVNKQCTFAAIASQDLDKAIRGADVNRIWYSLQAILIAAGNISKLLWPQPNTSARGDALRQSLSVKADSCLAVRTFRNHFEHFDERLERWIQSPERKGFFDSNVGPLGAFGASDSGDALRHFDPTTGTLFFRGDEYHLKPVLAEIQVLWEQTQAVLAQGLGLWP